MYIVGLPKQEKMAYKARVEALQHRFGQEHRTAGAGRTQKGKEPVGQGTGKQCKASGQ